ncbi:MAG: hypothetical protein ACOYI8_00315 [Christensenellales bacterium]|jgi:hypothetical protein
MRRAFFFGAAIVLLCIAALYVSLGLNPLQHSPYDSYSLQAQAWLDGKMTIDGDYPYLELAMYNGKQYLSFPPFPSVVMLPFVLIMGQSAPGGLIAIFLMLLSYCGAFSLARRMGHKAFFCAAFSVFAVLGCNYAEYGLYGGVWNLAQSLAFCLTMWAFALAQSDRKRDMGLSLLLIAFAVGCRPFQAVYALFLALLCFKKVKRDIWKLLIAPLFVAFCYGAYNAARFGNPLQFGHDYLPEFVEQSAYGQFSVHYIGKNLKNILRMPFFSGGLLLFPAAYGFAFWLTNPIYVLALPRKRMGAQEMLLYALCAVHFALLLCHKSFGGMQWGTRYLCDLVPALSFLFLKGKSSKWVYPAFAFGIALNLYGAVVFHTVLCP